MKVIIVKYLPSRHVSRNQPGRGLNHYVVNLFVSEVGFLILEEI